MKYIALLACLLFPGMSPGQEHPCPDALFRYWEFKDRLHKHFVRLDHWGDGIGTWDPGKMRYGKAGYGVPAAQLYVQPTACNHWEYIYGCYQSPDIIANCQISNVLNFGDSPIDMGYYMALLATEFELLQRNNQVEQAEKTLRELWLVLQAYRRLDMTANRFYSRWIEQNNPGCSFNENVGACGEIFPDPSFDGYSGFFLRDDVPHDLKDYFNSNAGGDKSWEVGGIISGYSCVEQDLMGNFLPDQATKGGNNIVSQDQMIGILFGLAFVRRFIPKDSSLYGQAIVEMSKKIATGMLRHIEGADKIPEKYRSIRYPGCLHETLVKRGADASTFFWGINNTIAYINGDAPVCTDGVDYQKWELIGKSACACDLPYYRNCVFNCRMLLELTAASDDGNFKRYQDRALSLNKEALILARFVLHNNRYQVYDIKHPIRVKLERILCLQPPDCNGPCYRGYIYNEPFFRCPNQPGWCHVNRLKGNNQDHVDCNYDYNISLRGNGIDYMLVHNLYLLTYFPDAPFFNPDNPTDETCFRLPNIFLGEKSVCPPGKTELHLPNELADSDEIQWGASQNLQIEFIGPSKKSVSISAENELDTAGWVRVKTVRNDCERNYSWSKIRIGPPPSPVLEDRSDPCNYRVCLNNENAEIFDIQWQLENISPTSYSLSPQTTCASIAFFTPPPHIVDVQVSLSNTCGNSNKTASFIFDCDDSLRRKLIVYPSPASDKLHFEIQNLSFHVLHLQPAKAKIYNSLSRLMFEKTIDSNFQTVDISTLGPGIYFLHIGIEGNIYSAKFMKH